ncbi:MAG: vitamin B12 dependent-methionine synthase activation domain-containing protein [Bacillota bacterium]|nr:vitamin B12 dependent-methionine synthase activation domain-containing protein [Bacillota bacterium]
MNIEVTKSIDRNKWKSMLGIKGDDEGSLKAQLDEAEKLIIEWASPKGIYKVMDVSQIKLEGFSIQKHLEGCDKVAVMAVTIGAGIDALLRTKQVNDMASAVIIDCGASLYIEEACDAFEEHIRNEVGMFTTPRFSPGYGDYPLRYQENILRYVDAQRKIGINITDDYLMVPRKSVTALIGISDHQVSGRLATCGECVLKDKCTLRKEGRYCGD